MKTIAVKLTLPQLWLIVEQMDKGAAAWELSKFTYIAERISKKLRMAVILAIVREERWRGKTNGRNRQA